MKDSYKASAEARAQRIAEKLASQKELEELIEFLDSAIDQAPSYAWRLSDIPDKEQYEACDDSEHMNRINTLIQAMEKAEPKTSRRQALLRRLARSSEHMQDMVSKFGEIKEVSVEPFYAACTPIHHVAFLNSDNRRLERLTLLYQSPLRANFESISEPEKSTDYPYAPQKINVEPITPVMQFYTNKPTKA